MMVGQEGAARSTIPDTLRALFAKVDGGQLALLAVLAVAVVVLGTLAKRIGRRRREHPIDDAAPWPYQVKRHVMGDAEQTLFLRLREALPTHVVLAQVGASRVLLSPEPVAWHNKIAQLSFDFVICTPDSAPVLVIELDDSTHERARNKERDAKKDRACRDAGLRLVRWNVRALPDVAEIRRTILPPVPAKPTAPPKPTAPRAPSEGPSKGYRIDQSKLPPRWPTHAHDARFWESLGRAVATFAFLEEMLKKAIYALTGTCPAPEEMSDRDAALEEWGALLERTLVATLSPLIDTFAKAAKGNPEAHFTNLDEFVSDLRAAARVRNILCHGSWGKPDANGASKAFYVTGKGEEQKAFDSAVTVAWIDQVQAHARELACAVYDSVTHMDRQFPGSDGPGRPLSNAP